MNFTLFYQGFLGIRNYLFECTNYSNLRHIFAHLSQQAVCNKHVISAKTICCSWSYTVCYSFASLTG